MEDFPIEQTHCYILQQKNFSQSYSIFLYQKTNCWQRCVSEARVKGSRRWVMVGNYLVFLVVAALFSCSIAGG